jgi:hypothetical protein
MFHFEAPASMRFFSDTRQRLAWQRDPCLREISLHQSADQSDLEEGVALRNLARKAQGLFDGQSAPEKRHILAVSDCTWRDRELRADSDSRLIELPKQPRWLHEKIAHPGWLGN